MHSPKQRCRSWNRAERSTLVPCLLPYAVVHWAFLEEALFKRTVLFARRAKVKTPPQAHDQGNSLSLNQDFPNRLLAFQGGIWEGIAVAYLDGSRPRSWQHLVWMLMTAAGLLLLVCAALSW